VIELGRRHDPRRREDHGTTAQLQFFDFERT